MRVGAGPCVRGGLAAGQIYEPYQSSSSLMKCLDGEFFKMGSGGSSTVTGMWHVKSPGGDRESVCSGKLLTEAVEANLLPVTHH